MQLSKYLQEARGTEQASASARQSWEFQAHLGRSKILCLQKDMEIVRAATRQRLVWRRKPQGMQVAYLHTWRRLGLQIYFGPLIPRRRSSCMQWPGVPLLCALHKLQASFIARRLTAGHACLRHLRRAAVCLRPAAAQ